MMDSQLNAILSHLKAGRPITAGTALGKFGCFRLAARIYDLKQMGHEIASTRVETKDKKKVSQYSMISQSEKSNGL